jgi:hypothetical protein
MPAITTKPSARQITSTRKPARRSESISTLSGMYVSSRAQAAR